MTDQYATPTSEVINQSQAGNYHYIGFWARTLASIIDNIWMGVVIVVLFVILAQVGLITLSEEFGGPGELLLQTLIPFALVLSLWVRYAATPGKMVFNAKILDADTFEPVPASRLGLRYISYFISLLPLCLGFFWVAFDDRKQGFHDKIARTVVVREE